MAGTCTGADDRRAREARPVLPGSLSISLDQITSATAALSVFSEYMVGPT